ncbi:AGE family epimerase/isomerase [Aeromicrobium chenweiae]|uniref:N-acyl-D-glucosamine 2-epimerase n=1 Tax=Aeromicrobium chenweiae TaxID=2079793 RepID=A0A2S0WSC8_9ACTN|nr:AGE family epimerase/isomerase [Aeromicrobium chenweiae]AWB94237.1 N-acyl-D-glucosamine 2-epimerase [Aeromicrobium chenweiae]TGN30834.1 AGE family epimerase/isomerase [Aeromicrobium chenweiae]
MSDDTPGSPAWRAASRPPLLEFARRSQRPEGGFVWLDDTGQPDRDKRLELWINARMTYVFALAHLAGTSDTLPLVEHGVTAMSTLFHDDVNGGWYDEVGFDGTTVDGGKRCYGHAFVLLAAAAASAAGAQGAQALLDEAGDIHAHQFWEPHTGRCREELSEDWSVADTYRGANSNMHTVEAYLVAGDVTGDPHWHERALAICERIIGIHARSHGWRIPEHYDEDWTPLPEFNHESAADPFRPYGATPGHAFEWSRLLVQLAAAMEDPKPWMREAAEALFARAVEDTTEDGVPGLAYTTDWHGEPVVRERFHWVMAEAVLAAEALHAATGKALYAGLASRWWSEIDRHFVDAATGSWHHELSPSMEQSTRTWRGKPDAYHAFNALTLPDLPLAPSAPMTIGAQG